jgi:hypothetical protein
MFDSSSNWISQWNPKKTCSDPHPRFRRKKEILAFSQLIAGTLIETASCLLDGLAPLVTNFQAHVTD